MSDYSFDSDGQSSQDDFVSQSESNAFSKSQRSQLQEQIQSLQRENNQLRAQFEQAVRLSGSFEEIQQKNSTLQSNLNSLQAEKDELSRRLNFSLQTNQKLTDKLEEERKSNSDQLSAFNAQKQKELNLLKNQYQSQYDKLVSHCQELENAQNKADLDTRVLNSHLQKLVDNATRYFDIQFPDYESISEYLESPTAQKQKELLNQQHQQQESISKPNEKVLEQKEDDQIKKYIKKLKAKINLLQSQISELQYEMNESQKNHKREIQKKNSEIQHLNEAKSNELHEKDDQIENLSTKLNSLSSENTRLKQAQQTITSPSLFTPMSPSQQSSISQQISQQEKAEHEAQTKRIHTLEEANNQLSQHNFDLSSQLQKSNSKIQDLNKKIDELNTDKTKAESAQQKLEGELQALQLIHSSLQGQNETLRNALHSRDSVKPKDDKEAKELHKQKVQIANMQKTIASQKQRIFDLQMELEKSSHELEISQKLETEAKNETQTAQEQIKDLNNQLRETKEIIENQHEITAEDIIPNYAWKSSDFPSELSGQIDQISSNNSLQPPSKLKSIYKAIAKFYSNLITEYSDTVKQTNEDLSDLHSGISSFLADISIALAESPISFDQFWEGNGGQIIVTKIQELKQGYEDSNRKLAEMNSTKNAFCQTFGTQFSPNEFATLKNQIDSQSEENKRRRRNCHEFKNTIKALDKKYQAEINELNNKLEDAKQMNEEQVEKIANYEKEKKENKKLIQKLQHELEDQKQENEEIKDEILQQNSNEQKQSENEMENNMILEKEKELNDAKESLKSSENKSLQLSKTISQQKQRIFELEENEKKLKAEISDVEKRGKDKAESEKQQLVSSYEKVINDLTEQCDGHRADIEKLAKELSENEKKIKEMRKAQHHLKSEKAKREKELRTEIEDEKRKASLALMSAKTSKMESETSCNAKLQQIQTKHDSEQRQFYYFVAEELKDYFNPMDEMGTNTIRRIIKKVKEDLTKFKSMDASVRKLVHAERGQRTDDAVAQILMDQ